MSVKARGDLDCRRAAAINEVVVKQNTDIVDQIRRLGKGSTNMLMRVTMMDDRPIFAGDAEELPSSLTRGKALPVEPATRSSEDLVRGGKGDKLFLVSRGVTPGVIPARYNQTGVTTSSASYVNHNTNLVMARSQGHAQHKDWEQAAKRKAELERNLEMIDREINSEYDEVKDSATGHGMFGRQSKADPLDLATGGNEMAMSFNFGDKVLGGSNAHHSKDVRDLTAPLKGLTAKKESTMKDSFIEHSYGLRMANAKGCKKTPIPIDKFRYSLLAPEGIDEKEIDISKSGLKTYVLMLSYRVMGYLSISLCLCVMVIISRTSIEWCIEEPMLVFFYLVLQYH